MKQKLLFFLSIFAYSVFAYGQTPTVTNLDLEKYKERRVQAEQGLKEYYAKHGVTDEDLAKREAEDNRSREELSARLRTTRLAEEQARFEQQIRAREATTQMNLVIGQQSQGYVYPGYYYYGNRWYPRPRGQGHFGNGVQWRATPMGVVYEPGSRPSTIWGPPAPASRVPAWRTSRTPR
jgi:hypothetical protein